MAVNYSLQDIHRRFAIVNDRIELSLSLYTFPRSSLYSTGPALHDSWIPWATLVVQEHNLPRTRKI